MAQPISIPRPLVRTNQWCIVLSVVATWITGWYGLLALPLVAGLLGISFDFNPVMKFARLFLHQPMSEYAQEDRDQQRFNQIIASTCLLLSIVGYALHIMVVAWIFTIMVALAASIAIMGFCIGCFIIFQWKQYRYRRSLRRA